MKQISLLKDKNYINGFNLRGLGGTDNDAATIKVIQFGTQEDKPSWQLGQWASRYSFADESVTAITQKDYGVFEMKNPTKHFTIDTNRPLLIFDCTASKCYDEPRKDGLWQHLLIETEFTDINNPDSYTKVSELTDIEVSAKIKLLKFEDKMDGRQDPELHAAQFLLFFTVHNANKDSKGFHEMIWFGITFFDNRYEWNEENSLFDVGTNCLIVGIGNRLVFPDGVNMFKDNKPNPGIDTPEFSVKVNCLDKLKDAYFKAKKEGYFENTELDDLYVTGMNMGWEIPGTYDVSMQVSEFDVLITTK